MCQHLWQWRAGRNPKQFSNFQNSNERKSVFSILICIVLNIRKFVFWICLAQASLRVGFRVSNFEIYESDIYDPSLQYSITPILQLGRSPYLPVPTGPPLSLNASRFTLKANRNQALFHDDGNLAFSVRVLKHGFELLWILHDIEISDLLACLGISLTGCCREGSGGFSEDENLF